MRPARIAKWLSMVTSLSVIACTQSGNESIAQGTTPETAVRAYANSLASGNMAAFWAHDWGYSLEVESKTKDIPKSMWTEHIERIKRQRESQIAQDRSAQSLGRLPWQVVRPGSRTEVLEIRAEKEDRVPPGYQSEQRSRWRAFVKVKYPSENQSPIGFDNQARRPVQEVTVIFQVVQDTRRSKQLLISGCDFVPRGISFWPIAALDLDAGLEIAKLKVPEYQVSWTSFLSRARSVTVEKGMVEEILENMPNQKLRNYAEVKRQLRTTHAILQNKGFRIKNPHKYERDHVVDDLEPPASWSKYSLGLRRSSYDGSNAPAYALSESVEITPLGFQQRNNSQASMRLQISYVGCTPVCELYRELQKVGPDWVDYVFLGSQGRDLPVGIRKRVHFSWSTKQGWQVTQVEDEFR